ncbi:MAG: hypothetical protein ACK4F6_19070 [Hylemonella sp.]
MFAAEATTAGACFALLGGIAPGSAPHEPEQATRLRDDRDPPHKKMCGAADKNKRKKKSLLSVQTWSNQ